MNSNPTALPTVYINGKFLAQRMTGVQRVAQELSRALDSELAAHADRLRVVLLHPQGARPPRLDHIECRPLALPAVGGLHAWEQWTLPRASRDGLLVSLGGAAAAFASRQVCMIHDAAVFDWPQAYTRSFVLWYRWLFRRLSRTACRVLTPSSFSRARLQMYLPGLLGRDGGSRVTVLPLAADHMGEASADPTVLSRHGLEGRPFLLAVASQNPSKNLAGLVAAYDSWDGRAGHALVLVGGSNHRVFRADTAAASSAPANGVVNTLGPVSDAELKALYQAAAGFVQPSWYEGFGLPPLEAMRSGCAVACAKAASLPEVCGDAAVYFDPGSAASMHRAFDELLLNQAALRDAGLRRAKQFSWQRSASLLLAELMACSHLGVR